VGSKRPPPELPHTDRLRKRSLSSVMRSKSSNGARKVFAIALLVLLAVVPADAQTYWQAPLTSDGAVCVRRTDLERLPSDNKDPQLLATKELINGDGSNNDQKYMKVPSAAQGAHLSDG
jgi:hypothetical protein